MKNLKVVYYIAAVFLAGVIALVYLSRGQSQQTVPKIKLGYFKSSVEVAQSIQSVVQSELKQQNHFWFGLEPGHQNEIEIYQELRNLIEKENGPFDIIYIDQELRLPPEKNYFGAAVVERSVRENWDRVAQDLRTNQDKKVLVITASIYSTNLLPQNPIYKIKEASGIIPMTFSMGYFAATPEEERKIVFPCVTDDKEGVAAWGCLVVNKARGHRRKLNMAKLQPPESSITGLMDETGEKDYMILVR